MKKYFLLGFFVVVFCADVLAETIYLTDGSKVSGVIMSRDLTGVVIKLGNSPRKIFTAQISRIEEDKDAPVDGPRLYFMLSLEEQQLIKRLMNAVGMTDIITHSVSKIVNSAPLAKQDEMVQIFNQQEIEQKVAEIYAGHYNKEELQKLVSFYESEIGQKSLRVAPQMTNDVMRTITEHLKEKAAIFSGK